MISERLFLNMPNRLITEKSPYLLQHAHNPVNWYPWGQEAFDAAAREDKPVFLSIGYSTCHWCHVMEHESFEDTDVAELLNQNFISIKVDREERPDIDAVYMNVCQAMTGQGGWPLTILLTPAQAPFFAGTYFPKNSRGGMPGLLEILAQVTHLWRTKKEDLIRTGNEITRVLSQEAEEAAGEVSKKLPERTVKQLKNSFDSKNGGFGSAPKFPSPQNLLFLLEYSKLENSASALQMAEKTLEQMYRGGIFDQIGGGFSRYSTDEFWLVPHFEKMLYDNALLSYTYAQAYQLTGNELYGRVVEQTVSYVLRELTDEQGGFYCGQDADSDGVEGKYYVFTPQEIHQVLASQEAQQFCSDYDIGSNHFEGKSIPNLLHNKQIPQTSNHVLERLYQYRLQRTQLHKDDKILTAWNGLMIGTLAQAGRAMDRPDYLEAAGRTVQFLEKKLMAPNARLLVRWRDGEAAGQGKIDDYAFFAWGLLELHRATLDLHFLDLCIGLMQTLVEQFFDVKAGGFYLYASDGERLIHRPKEVYDGAIPSGNSVAALVLNWLFACTGEVEWERLAQKQFGFLAGQIHDYPAGFCFAQLAILRRLSPSRQLVICTAERDFCSSDFLKTIKNRGNLTVLLKTKANSGSLEQIAPFTKSYPIPQSGTVFYLCQNGTCSAPVDKQEALLKMLDG